MPENVPIEIEEMQFYLYTDREKLKTDLENKLDKFAFENRLNDFDNEVSKILKETDKHWKKGIIIIVDMKTFKILINKEYSDEFEKLVKESF